jgi:hypothetical protein
MSLSPQFAVLLEKRRRQALAYHRKMTGWEPTRWKLGRVFRFEDDDGRVADYAPTKTGWIALGTVAPELEEAIETWFSFARVVAEMRGRLNKSQSDLAYDLIDSGFTVRQVGALLGVSAQRIAKIAPQRNRGEK